MHLFPAQANGYPGIDFGNQCWAAEPYPGPGYRGQNKPANNRLRKCPNLQRDLHACRQQNTGIARKTILLSVGGGSTAYQLTGAADGDALAKQLWYMFGPRQNSWVKQGLPRPFDLGSVGFAVDGFDLDIEHRSTDGGAGYKALATRLRSLYATQAPPGSKFYLTASPQCAVPDANMRDVLVATAFDAVFVQFYNTPQCSARRWADANRGYVPGGPVKPADFTYDAWTAFLGATKYSKNARVFLGLPASAAAARPGFDLSVKQATDLVNAFYCRPNFGGVAVWDATYAAAHVVGGRNFYQNMKGALDAASRDKRLSCTKK